MNRTPGYAGFGPYRPTLKVRLTRICDRWLGFALSVAYFVGMFYAPQLWRLWAGTP